MRAAVASRIMARTTLDLDPTILRELKERAEREGKPMGRLASELLAPALKEQPRAEEPPFEWKSHDMGLPLVDLEDKEAVWAILDDRDR